MCGFLIEYYCSLVQIAFILAGYEHLLRHDDHSAINISIHPTRRDLTSIYLSLPTITHKVIDNG